MEQNVTIKWITRNKKRYVNLGYTYTGLSTEFSVKLKDLETNSNEKVVVSCDECGAKIMTPYRNYNRIVLNKGGYYCRKCNAKFTSDIRVSNNKDRQLKYFENAVAEKGYTSIATVDDYVGCEVPMPFICSKHGVQKLSIQQLQQGCSCPRCRTSYNKLSIDDIMIKVNEKNNDILLNPEDYVDTKTSNLRIQCGSCGKEFVTNFASIYGSNGYCPDCAKLSQIKNSILSQKILIGNTTRNGKCYLVNPKDYKKAYEKNLEFICDECGDTYICDYVHYCGGQIRCAKCTTKNNSLGEYLIMKYLDAHNIKYIQQYKINECKHKRPLPFDFYLPDYDLLIEFDGIQHFKMTSRDTKESFRLRKLRDKIKDDYCKKEGIELLRIKYLDRDNIGKILNKKLNII